MTTAVEEKQTIKSLINSDFFKKSLKDALPNHLSPERMVRLALTELRNNPKLMECDALSVAGAIIKCSQLGLEIGNGLGHAYLVPYYNKHIKMKECQFIPGYRGMIDLAYRSGAVISVEARLVREGDVFEFEYGSNKCLRHIPGNGQGDIKFIFAGALFKGGNYEFDVMYYDEIKQYIKEDGPWKTSPGEMMRKTVVRRLFKYLPISVELSRAITFDEEYERGAQNNALIMQPILESEETKSVTTEPTTKADRLAQALTEKDKEKEDKT